MATTGLALDDRFQEHDTGRGHPERPERLEAITAALRDAGLDEACQAIDISRVHMELVQRVHAPAYIERLMRACSIGSPYIDEPDSAISPQSYDIALLAAGTVINAVDDIMTQKIDNAFCAIRPPGHHCEHDRSMGFCLLNNAAIAARHLIDDYDLERILILDWDVHHGNGTQHIFETSSRVQYISIHGHPTVVYPGTGYETERGLGEGQGFTLNICMKPHSKDTDYRVAFDDVIMTEVERFSPQFIIISAGFDAHRADPLAPIDLDTESFGWMTDDLAAAAKNHAQGRLLSLLEGGYNLDATAASVKLHVERLLDA